MKRLMTKLLSLPGVIVEDSKEAEETIFLYVSKERQTAVCPRCGKASHRLHQNQRYLVKDLPIGNKQVILNGFSATIQM